MRVYFPEVKLMRFPPLAAADTDIPANQFAEQLVRPASAGGGLRIKWTRRLLNCRRVPGTSPAEETRAAGRDRARPRGRGVRVLFSPVVSCATETPLSDQCTAHPHTDTRAAGQVANRARGGEGTTRTPVKWAEISCFRSGIFKIRQRWELFAFSDWIKEEKELVKWCSPCVISGHSTNNALTVLWLTFNLFFCYGLLALL